MGQKKTTQQRDKEYLAYLKKSGQLNAKLEKAIKAYQQGIDKLKATMAKRDADKPRFNNLAQGSNQ